MSKNGDVGAAAGWILLILMVLALAAVGVVLAGIGYFIYLVAQT